MSARIKAEPLDDEEVLSNIDMVLGAQDDDEVVHEIDVYLSPALESQFYLMQYPLQHRSVPLPQGARIKPVHGMLELDQAVPRNFARQDLPDALNLYQRTFVSHTIPVSTHLAVGKLEVSQQSDNKKCALHLVPLSHVTQMRPDFNHIDQAMNPSHQDGDNTADEDADRLERKPVMFQKKESDRAAMARQNSYAYKKASEASEEWQNLEIQGPGTPAHQRVRQAVACPSPHNSLVHVAQEKPNEDPCAAFVHSLNYLPATSGTETATLDEMNIDEGDLKQVCAKLTHFLHQGWPVPYSVIRARFSPALDDYDLLTALASCAFMVRGNFVLQSRLLSLPAPMQQARTFLLFLIHTFGYVQRFRLENVYQGDTIVTPEVIHMLLQQVAEKTLNGWKSKVDDNFALCQNFPEQTQMHFQYWERQSACFANQLQKYQEAVYE